MFSREKVIKLGRQFTTNYSVVHVVYDDDQLIAFAKHMYNCGVATEAAKRNTEIKRVVALLTQCKEALQYHRDVHMTNIQTYQLRDQALAGIKSYERGES